MNKNTIKKINSRRQKEEFKEEFLESLELIQKSINANSSRGWQIDLSEELKCHRSAISGVFNRHYYSYRVARAIFNYYKLLNND